MTLHSPSFDGGAALAPDTVPGALYVASSNDTHPAIRPVARISSDSLLAGSTEVHIEHRGSLYRLKQTSLGKLILTK
jgi:hemin uptake protein HemP